MLIKVVKQKTSCIVDSISLAFFSFQHIQLPLLALGGRNSRWLWLCHWLSTRSLHHQWLPVAQPEPPAVPPICKWETPRLAYWNFNDGISNGWLSQCGLTIVQWNVLCNRRRVVFLCIFISALVPYIIQVHHYIQPPLPKEFSLLKAGSQSDAGASVVLWASYSEEVQCQWVSASVAIEG